MAGTLAHDSRTARTRVYGCEEPTRKANKAITDLFLRENIIGAEGAIALVKGLKTRHGMRFLEVHTSVFSRHCQGSACDTHSSWFQTVCET